METKQAIMFDLYLSKDYNVDSVNAQKEVLKKIADNGSAVIVGRAADNILKNNYQVFRIFFYANMDYKVKNIMYHYNDANEEAINHIKESDISRSKYYEQITSNKWKNPHNYDCCLNVSKGIEYNVNLIIKMIQELNLYNK